MRPFQVVDSVTVSCFLKKLRSYIADVGRCHHGYGLVEGLKKALIPSVFFRMDSGVRGGIDD
jgi:hypothetical protein